MSEDARAHSDQRRYNTAVPTASPPPDRSSKGPSQEDRPPRSRAIALEAGGILITGALILIFILARSWHHIAWGAR